MGTADPAPPAPPPAGDATICWTVNNGPDETPVGGVVTVTATKPAPVPPGGAPKVLSVPAPVAQNASPKAVALIVKTLMPAAWADPADYAVADNCIVFKGVSEIDGDPGDTKLKMTWVTTTKGMTVTGRKVKVRKNPKDGVGSGGFLSLSAAGLVNHADGSASVQSSEDWMAFYPTDTDDMIVSRAVGRLTSYGWTVTWDASTPNDFVIRKIPGGIDIRSLSMTVYRESEDSPIDYHWAIEFVE